MKMKLRVLSIAVLLTITASGCSTAEPSNTSRQALATSTATADVTTEAMHTVLMENHAFTPTTLTIKVGESVTWTNKDSAKHNVVFEEFESSLLGKDESYSHTFATAGSFSYTCGPHPYMEATIVVE